MQNFKEIIKSLVKKNKTGDALQILLEKSITNKPLNEAVHIVIAEYNELISQKLKGTIDSKESNQKNNIINEKIFIALDSFNENGKPLPGRNVQKKSKTPKLLLKIGGILFLAGIIIGGSGFAVVNKNENLGLIILIISYYITVGGLLILGIWIIVLFFRAIKDS